MTRRLDLTLETCNPCPYMSIVGGREKPKRMTVVACRHPFHRCVVYNSLEILSQPMDWVLAEVEIPGWCPLPGIGD